MKQHQLPLLTTASGSPHEIGLRWLMRLRWATAGAAAVAVATLALTGAALPFAALACLIGTALASNAWLALAPMLRRTPRSAVLGSVLLLDIVTWTITLAITGGPSNPFTIVFLVYVTLAAIVLSAAWTWSLAAATSLAYAALFFFAPVDHGHSMAMHSPLHGFHLHLYGMLAAFCLTAMLIAYLVTRVTANLREREAQLQQGRERLAHSERLAAITTLAAGAAHELSTPLATIAVVVGELAQQMRVQQIDAELLQDAQLIRQEVARCRHILDRMAGGMGQPSLELRQPLCLLDLQQRLALRLGTAAERIVWHLEGATQRYQLPHETLLQILESLLRNAFAASAKERSVQVHGAVADEHLTLRIVDQGTGMPQEVLARASEPFFTTKEPGCGMGLGLFLARVLSEQLGGSMQMTSAVGQGTAVCLQIPCRPSPLCSSSTTTPSFATA